MPIVQDVMGFITFGCKEKIIDIMKVCRENTKRIVSSYVITLRFKIFYLNI